MNKISEFLELWLARLLMALMAAIIVDVSWQVLTRFITQDPSSFTEELARFLLMWIGLIGAALAYRRHSHLSLELLQQSLNPSQKKSLARIIHSLCFLFSALVLVFGGWQLVALTLSLQQYSAALNLPMGVVYLCLPISGVLICWFALDFLLHSNTDQQVPVIHN